MISGTKTLGIILAAMLVLLSATSSLAFPWQEIPAFRFVCKSQIGSIAQFAFDPLLQPPVSVKIGSGPTARLAPSSVTAHPDFDYREKDKFGYDVANTKRPIVLQLMNAGPYGLLQADNFATGWVLIVETDGHPTGTGVSREFYNCLQSSRLDID